MTSATTSFRRAPGASAPDLEHALEAAVARRVIAVSQATAADLQRYYATSPAKIRVIHEAVAAMPAPSRGEIAAAPPMVCSGPTPSIGSIQPRRTSPA